MELNIDEAKLTDLSKLRVVELQDGCQALISKIDKLADVGAAQYDAAKEKLAQDISRVKEDLAFYMRNRIQEIVQHSECTMETLKRLETAEHLMHSLCPGGSMPDQRPPTGSQFGHSYGAAGPITPF
ncbi:hypothetical protein CVIRNUC_001623 [Coccomyxa viridis]|uniref:Uncharacterized protein n=1 Tax=Coccomyxa viridis TaxID=1274662 RepID=A0AAV1HY18_9CHLO|nr:hypothetical protein CVIRNUC_001623 [Coccomyxa viridis]